MGTDIHAAIEFRKDNQWQPFKIKNRWYNTEYEDEPEFTPHLDIDRNYKLFSILANVRNGYGFALCDTGDGFVPMSDGRGLPEDIHPETKEHGTDGDHSATYVTLAEILSYNWDRTTKLRGYVGVKGFIDWRRMIRWQPGPDSYCGGVAGGHTVIITNEEMMAYVKQHFGEDFTDFSDAQIKAKLEMLKLDDKNMYYTQVEWEQVYVNCCPQMWTQILRYMLPLGAMYGQDNVRLVMNFDS